MSDELRNIGIDTNALNQQITNLKKERDNLNTILENIKKSNEVLRDSWDSKTSESVFNNFKDMYVGYQELMDDLNKDITFLEGVIADFKSNEEQTNKKIEAEISS